MRALVLLGLLLGAGLSVWLLVEGSAENERAAEDPDGGQPTGPAAAAPDDPPAPRGVEPPTKARGPTEPVDPIPRILPPDAAMEDIRDALSRKGAARSKALQAAYADTGRIGAGSARTRRALQRQIERHEDARVRGVATAALGASRAEGNHRWLRDVLASGNADEDRIGALIALARPADAKGDQRATASSEALGSLRYEFEALPDDQRILKAMMRFLGDMDGARSKDAVPIILASVRKSPRHATLLAADGKTSARWYRTLSPEHRATVRDAALKHANLLPEVRRTLEAEK